MMSLFRAVIVFCLVLCVCLYASQTPSSDKGIEAITLPSADITLSFLQPGKIDKIFVKEGNKADANALLIQQYDVAESALLEQKKVDLNRLEQARKQNAATDLEVEHARLEVRTAEVQLDNMKMRSPIEGIVEKLDVEVGESVQALKDVIRIVKIDPLWVDVYVSQRDAYNIKLGDSAAVRFPEPQKATMTGNVIFISRAADAASDTRRVRIELPNKTGRPSGEHVTVNFSTGNKPNESGKKGD